MSAYMCNDMTIAKCGHLLYSELYCKGNDLIPPTIKNRLRAAIHADIDFAEQNCIDFLQRLNADGVNERYKNDPEQEPYRTINKRYCGSVLTYNIHIALEEFLYQCDNFGTEQPQYSIVKDLYMLKYHLAERLLRFIPEYKNALYAREA